MKETHGQDDDEVSDSGRARSVDRTAAASSSSTRPPAYTQIPTSSTHFSTVQSDARAGAIRVEISDPEQWSSGDVAILKNQPGPRLQSIC